MDSGDTLVMSEEQPRKLGAYMESSLRGPILCHGEIWSAAASSSIEATTISIEGKVAVMLSDVVDSIQENLKTVQLRCGWSVKSAFEMAGSNNWQPPHHLSKPDDLGKWKRALSSWSGVKFGVFFLSLTAIGLHYPLRNRPESLGSPSNCRRVGIHLYIRLCTECGERRSHVHDSLENPSRPLMRQHKTFLVLFSEWRDLKRSGFDSFLSLNGGWGKVLGCGTKKLASE